MNQIKLIKQNKKLDPLTVDIISGRLKARLNDDALANTYIIEHTRQLEAELV